MQMCKSAVAAYASVIGRVAPAMNNRPLSGSAVLVINARD
jgi:hypothetical protein